MQNSILKQAQKVDSDYILQFRNKLKLQNTKLIAETVR